MKNKLIIRYTCTPLRQFCKFFTGNKNPWDYKIVLVTSDKEKVLYSEIGFKIQLTEDNLSFNKIIEKIGYWEFLKVLFPDCELEIKNLDYKKGEIELNFKNLPEEIVDNKHNPSFLKFSDPSWLRDRIRWDLVKENLDIEYKYVNYSSFSNQ